uniref:Serine/arginine repetitive matrix protein 1-like n=1 Tax=Pundamilia nyererei TaxID=303518 RepID=A0A3B4H9S9_9CICH
MAETVRSLFEYRDPHSLDSDGEGVKPAPAPRRGCGRKRKGTPMKVFVTPTEEESVSEHRFSPGVSFPPSPNCRIREVHCGNQVRLVVIAIRDITKGEEITVDYSLTEWGENLQGFRGTVSPAQHDCSSDTETNNIKKSSPPCSSSSTSVSSAKPVFKPPGPLASNTTCSVTANVSRGGVSIDSMRQTCEYCGRHFRSLGRHLDKHHAHQPDVCSALVERYTQMPRLQAQNSNPASAHTHTQQRSKLSHATGQSRGSDLSPGSVQDLSMSPPTLMSGNQSPAPSSRNSTPPVLTPPRGQNAVPVSVLKRSPPPVALTQSKKGAMRKLKKERQVEEEEEGMDEDEEDVEVVEVKRPIDEDEVELVCPQSFSTKLAKEIQPPKEEEDEEEEEEEESGRHHMLPLLSSLSSLVLYLRRLQHSAFLSLSRQLQSAEAWRLLCHSSLALLILYNRRRECEVSKLSISEYRARVTPQCPVPVPPGAPPALTPLEASLSPFERMVLPHLPRVGVQGKRGRVQPLILPPHCEPCLELLLQTRQDVGVDPANPYVFARPYHSPATPLRGTDLLRSLARSSGTRNPRALTQTRVRRQVAILTQLLLLGEGEEPGQLGGSAVERLEHFLEREYHVTQNCAGIGQDPGLMGRVGRVVLCGERDGVLFRGMSLNHICLELDMSGNSADSYSEGESEGENMKEKPEVHAPAPALNPTPTLLYVRKGKNNGRVGRPKKLKNNQPPPPLPLDPPPANRRRGTGQPKSGKRGVLKRPWSEAERAAVEEHLTQNINELRVPAKADCERCLQQCPLLVNNHRDWRAIKFYCHNRIQLLKKNQRRESEPQPLTVC